MVISKKTMIFQGFRGGPTFSKGGWGGGGGPTFSRGSIKTHIACDYQGGGSGPPIPPPLDPYTVDIL